MFLGWGFLPLTIGATAYRFLVRGDASLSYVLLGVLTVSIAFTFGFYQSARATVRSEGVGWRWLSVVGFPILLFLCVGTYATQMGLQGKLPGASADIQLRQADLSKADLSRLRLQKANLYRASLSEAILAEANLSGADLSGVKGLTQEQIALAIIDEETKLPDEWKKR